MKLKITEPGWINFTGDFGGVDFVDNVSTRDVSPFEAQALANAIQIETLEGVNPSSSQIHLDSLQTPMSTTGDPAAATAGVDEALKAKTTTYTRTQLEAVADAGGIDALRKISTLMGITNRSINGLIDAIINNQGGVPMGDGTTVPQMLLGSSKQPATFEVSGKTIQLGSVVRLAFEQYEKGGKTVADWNSEPDEHREALIAQQVDLMKV